ncbi:MAG: alpha/beta fold hydrolase [Cyanobacteria bacterium P01_H01_bin.15]
MGNWLVCPFPRSQPQIRLFCFAYAGGAASVFHHWGAAFPSSIEVCAIELPGRARRLIEPPFQNLPELLAALGPALLPYTNIPFACFGHSLGALLAYEFSHWTRQKRQQVPKKIFVSAASSPNLPQREPLMHVLNDQDFIAELKRYNGTPHEVLENTELMEFMLPTLKADFAILETYQYPAHPILKSPIQGFWGQTDEIVTQEEMQAWSHLTIDYSLKTFPGDHFFLFEPKQLDVLHKMITQDLLA